MATTTKTQHRPEAVRVARVASRERALQPVNAERAARIAASNAHRAETMAYRALLHSMPRAEFEARYPDQGLWADDPIGAEIEEVEAAHRAAWRLTHPKR